MKSHPLLFPRWFLLGLFGVSAVQADPREELLKQYPRSFWYAADKNAKIPKKHLLPMGRGNSKLLTMSLGSASELRTYHGQTMFLVYERGEKASNETLLRIGDLKRKDHGFTIREQGISFQNHTDFNPEFYRYRHEKFPDDAARKDPVLDTQRFSLIPAATPIDQKAEFRAREGAGEGKYEILAIRSDSIGKAGPLRVEVDWKGASVFARGARGKRVSRSTKERVALSRAGKDLTDYYYAHRIPTACVTQTGRIVVAWEGRRDSIKDMSQGPNSNPIDICYAASDDGGQTWSRTAVAIPYGADELGKTYDRMGDMGNPCLGFDATTNTIWMVFRRGPHTKSTGFCCTKSTDNGKTWGFEDGSLYRVISKDHYRPGPSTIVQIPPKSFSPEAGHLFVSAVMDRDQDKIAIWSLKPGTERWERVSVIENDPEVQKTPPLGDFVAGEPGDGEVWETRFDESDLFYCEANQNLYLSSRKAGPYTGPSRRKGLAHDIKEFGRYYLESSDSGRSWSYPTEYYQYALSQCQQSHIAHRDVLFWFAAGGDHLKLFTCPSRTGFHCFTSINYGRTWEETLINIPPVEVKGPHYETTPYLDFAAYSVAVKLGDGRIGTVVERGSNYAKGGDGTSCYCNLTFYPFSVRYPESMNQAKLADLARGRTEVFRDGRVVAVLESRADINLLADYATKNEIELVLGDDEGGAGRIAEVVIIGEVLSDSKLAKVHASLEKIYANK